MTNPPFQTIPQLPPAGPLSGAEKFWAFQSGLDVSPTLAAILAAAGQTAVQAFPQVFTVGQNYLTLAQAVAAMGTAPGRILLPPGTWLTPVPIVLGQGQSIEATAPGVVQTGGTGLSGTAGLAIIQADPVLFPQNQPVILVSGAYGAAVFGVCIDCSNIPGAIGLQYTSNNAPPSSLCRFQDVSVVRCHIGFCFGSSSMTPDPNNFECDFFVLDGFEVKCNLADLTSIGIHHNSGNSNGGLIRRGNINGCNIGYNGVEQNGNMILEQFNAGTPIGSNPTCFYFGANYGQYILREVETEGNWTYCINDQSTYGVTNIWEGCQFFSTAGSIIVGGQVTLPLPANSTILSMGNQQQGATGRITCTAPAKVFSLCEAIWTAGPQVATIGVNGSTFNNLIRTASYIAATVALVVGTSVQPGDLIAARAAATGQLWLGTDNLGGLTRNAAGNLQSVTGWLAGVGGFGYGQANPVTPTAGRSLLATTNVAPFRLALSNDVAPASPVAQTVGTTVAGLATAFPAGALGPIAGDRAVVTDCNTNVFLAAVAGGGANRVPVFYDGTGWKVG